jgi:Tfp pilus assembly protein PilF
MPPQETQPAGNTPQGIVFYDEIDRLSNSVVDSIKAGKLDEAEVGCKELLRRFPDQVDGIERMAMVEEARGNYQQAAQY